MLCDASLDRFAQADHTQPLRMSVTEEVNALENMRLLCTTCHSSATANVSQSLPTWDPLASWFADDRFTCSPRPKQLITKLNALDVRQQMLLIDIRRCRFSICRNSAYDTPVMCCHDEFFQAGPERIGDFTWVNVNEPKTMAAFQRSLPFTGSRFYHRSCVEWGLAVKKITYSNLGLAINGSGNLPAGYLKDPLDALERAWQNTGDPSLSKKSVNCWLGLFANDEHFTASSQARRASAPIAPIAPVAHCNQDRQRINRTDILVRSFVVAVSSRFGSGHEIGRAHV